MKNIFFSSNFTKFLLVYIYSLKPLLYIGIEKHTNQYKLRGKEAKEEKKKHKYVHA